MMISPVTALTTSSGIFSPNKMFESESVSCSVNSSFFLRWSSVIALSCFFVSVGVSFSRETHSDGNEKAAQSDHGRPSQEKRRINRATDRFAFEHFIGRKDSARCCQCRDRRDHHSGQSQDHQDAAAQTGQRLRPY